MFESPHRRFNPLTREWVLVSPHRSKRPWLGQVEKTAAADLPKYDSSCYLCPGNERAGGIHNAQYTGTYVFENDFASLLPELPASNAGFVTLPLDSDRAGPGNLLIAAAEQGLCRVVCFSPRHDLTLPELDIDAVTAVIQAWARESSDLASKEIIKYVQVFENKGAAMGCSNPHPHSQLWAQSHLPNEIEKELSSQIDYFQANKQNLLLDYLTEELKRKDRVVATSDHFSAVVPFWAVWPFEVLVIAHKACCSLSDMTSDETRSLADIFKQVTTMYDNLFEISFPYSMGFHQAPEDGQPHPEWVLHAHFYPPLLRSATVRKFMVGYEMLAMPQRDITPESAAERLRSLPKTHYKNK